MEHGYILSILYEMALVIGGETSVKPLLTRMLQRLLYHTSFPAGFVCLNVPAAPAGADLLEVRIDAAVGDYELAGLIGQTVRMPAHLLHGRPERAEDAALLAALPEKVRRHEAYLRLPIDGHGVIVLLAPHLPDTDLPLTQLFEPVMANLAKAIVLCSYHDSYTGGLIAAREASEEKFRAISAAAQDALIMVDDSGTLVYWNPAAERILGYRVDEALGKPMHQLLTPQRYRDHALQGFETFRTSGQGAVVGKTIEIEALHKDGREIPVELSISALRMGERWHAVGILRDISERKRAEQELRLLAAIVESSDDAIISKSLDGIILSWNAGAERLYGYSAAEMLGQPVSLLAPEGRPDEIPGLLERIRHGERIKHYETARRRKDGVHLPVSLTISPLHDASGQVVGASAIGHDITQRKQAELVLQKSNRALHALSTCNGALVRATEEKQLLDEICRILVETGNYRLAWVGYAEHDPERSVRIVARAGAQTDYLERIRISWDDVTEGRGPVGKAIRSGQLQLTQDIQHDPDFEPWRARAAACGYASIIALPLFDSAGQTFGAINLYGAEPNAFDADEIRLLQELAGDLAFGIRMLRLRTERDHLHEQQLHHDETVRQALAGTIQAIAVTVEKRDPYTAGHQRRVANLSVAIAMELGLADERITGLRLGATIHDIGKIYVPAEILTRPGLLSQMERDFIKIHPQVGYDIMKDVKLPWPVAEMILQHHERLDGSGYPQGLKGDAILLEARILTVADVTDAMMSHRPYRPSLGIDAALDEIGKYRDVYYDPDVVDACVRLFRDKGFRFEE